MGIQVFLWSLLFIIPGIIAVLRYSQAFFILAEDPSKGIMACINESKYYMNGNKGKFFCLSLSFIGWAILAMVPLAFLPYFSGVLGIIVDLLYSCSLVFLPDLFVYGKGSVLRSGKRQSDGAPAKRL